MTKNRNQLAAFIDGANLHSAAKSLGFEIDFRRLLLDCQGRGRLLRAFYYTAVADEAAPIHALIDWLDYNGFAVVTKPSKEFTDTAGRRKVKRSMAVELAVDALEIAAHVDHVMLFSGDGDFSPLVAALQRKSVRVSVVSTALTQPPMVADELRRQADEFIELHFLADGLRREPASGKPIA
ncbi:NYN domain-containing protein [Methylocapsa acidiphila]|uniref:LabA-like NYN domain-containing protein n=1 Tax=Methylocapsa acidiphila TaxID=133552 RepID=UPI000416EF8C|nr:NYN domain-containing protein [Methylocapsa acidiphila]